MSNITRRHFNPLSPVFIRFELGKDDKGESMITALSEEGLIYERVPDLLNSTEHHTFYRWMALLDYPGKKGNT